MAEPAKDFVVAKRVAKAPAPSAKVVSRKVIDVHDVDHLDAGHLIGYGGARSGYQVDPRSYIATERDLDQFNLGKRDLDSQQADPYFGDRLGGRPNLLIGNGPVRSDVGKSIGDSKGNKPLKFEDFFW